MQITIESPHGPGRAVVPSEGIGEEAMLVKSLLLTLAVERNRGADDVTLDICLDGADPQRMVALAKEFSNMTKVRSA